MKLVDDIRRGVAAHGLALGPNITLAGYFDFEAVVDIREQCLLARSLVGSYSYVMELTQLNECSVGRYCSIGKNVNVVWGGHPTSWLTTSPALYDGRMFERFGRMWDAYPLDNPGRVEVGHDVWIGANAVILRGVRIGHGAVIGANTVVTRDIEPYAVVAGNPGRVIKKRFSDPLVERLLTLPWYDLDLIAWGKRGDMPDLRRVDNDSLDRLDEAISAAAVPKLTSSVFRMAERSGGGITLARL